MTDKLEITQEAEQDISSILTNIQQQNSLSAAKSTLATIRQQINKLSEFPDSGREGVCDGTREFVVTGLPYIVVYESTKDSISIIRVLYGAA